MKMMLTHPTGNENVRALLIALERTGLLHSFHTTIAINPESFAFRLLPVALRKELQKRVYPVNYAGIHVKPLLELGRYLMPRIGLKHLVDQETGFLSIDQVCRNLDLASAAKLASFKKQGLDAIYAYEDSALHSFKAAKEQGIQCMYDLPIGYWKAARQLLQQEGERWPQWVSTIETFWDKDEKLQRKDEELRLAERIFVASSFTAKTLQAYPGKLAPVEIIPYGFPAVAVDRRYTELKNRKLKLLYVGSLSQRKGIADLFAAVQNLSADVELTILGPKTGADCPALDNALKAHRYIPPVPHDEVLRIMQAHDVLVFPSLFEGFGLVITEAMSQGMPVITTDRTAGPDLITHGKDGWLIEAGSTIALQQAMEKLLDQPDRVTTAGMAAIATARKRPWFSYGKELTAALKGVIHETA
ncbi:glycosyltransferase family 4 protein [Pedobacter immunditicola]|uniref:glycosyltransferase family 4 protein n=1 Tax=Pedobacter immunditicola TaxID=3133440 RepID=UPI0030A1C867